MNESFLNILVGPDTKDALIPDRPPDAERFINEGYLVSPANKFPVVDGIPRFVEYKSDNYSRSFAYRWRKWPRVQFDADNVGKPMEGYTQDMWARITGHNKAPLELQCKVVVDIDCGSGRFVDIVREEGACVIGIDNSIAAEEISAWLDSEDFTQIKQTDWGSTWFRSFKHQ